MKLINPKVLKKDLNDAVRSCKKLMKGLPAENHERVDLEGKVYAYEFVRDILMLQND